MQSDGKTILWQKKLCFDDSGPDPGLGDFPGGGGRFVPLDLVFFEQQFRERIRVELAAFHGLPEVGGGGIQRDDPLEIHRVALADHDIDIGEFPQDESFFEMHGAKIAISAGNPYLYLGIHRGMPDRNDIFFAVLRAGLWEQDLRLEAAPSPEDWQALLQIARSQAVLGLFFRGMSHLGSEQLPPPEARLPLLAEVDRLERRAAALVRVQEELLAHLAEAGLRPLVQKGTEAAKYYARPLLRESGDIDLYFTPAQFTRARELMAPGTPLAPDGSLVYRFREVVVEHHPRYFDLHVRADKLPEVPSVIAELLLLSAHILKHAIGEGVGCKQLCDMAAALARTDGSYDKAVLRETLRRCGLLRWHRLLCSLLVADLGLDPACCLPGFTACNPAPLRRIVLAGGAFGVADASRREALRGSAFARKMHAAGAFLRRLPFSLCFAPRETLATVAELVRGNLG